MAEELHVNTELINRAKLASILGLSFSGERDIYKALGYPKELGINEFYAQFKRQDMAKAIIERPIKATWQGNLGILESDDDQQTPLEKAWDKLVKEQKLKEKFIRLDRLVSLGRYGALMLGFNDVRVKDDALKPATGKNLKLMYVKPLSEQSCKISTFDTKPSSPRYGLPVTYEVSINSPEMGTGAKITILVHHSRILHIVGDKLESEIYGIPVLESVYNRLLDLEKLVGGSAEMFWKGARPGHHAKVADNFTLGEQGEKDLKDQIAEYEHDLRRILTVQGVDLNSLDSQVANPKDHVDVQVQMISAVTGIPKRVLTGSERGELASSQDREEWKELIQSRRLEYASPIVEAFVNKMIEHGILPEAKDEFTVQWEDLFAMSEQDKAEVGKTRASALREYTANPMASVVIPETAFMQFFLGLSENEIEVIEEMRKQAVLDEDYLDFPEDEGEDIEGEDKEKEDKEDTKET